LLNKIWKKKVYEPAVFYASNPNSHQLLDLVSMLTALLRHPHVAFDMYAHDIVLRLVGTLYSSHAWLSMKKLDKLVQEVHFNLSSGSAVTVNAVVQSLLDTLNNSLRIQQLLHSQAELETGLGYSYAFAFGNVASKVCIDQLFVHTMKLLCVLACVVDETALPSHLTANLGLGSTAVTAPPPPPMTLIGQSPPQQQPPAPTPPSQTTSTNSSSLNTSTSSLSSSAAANQQQQQQRASPGFLKSKFTSLAESKLLSKNSSTSSLLSSPPPPSGSSSGTSTPTNASSSSSSLLGGPVSPKTNKDEPQPQPPQSSSSSQLPQQPQQSQSLPKTTTNIYLGYFQNSSHYLKLYENLKVLFNLYKKSPSIGKSALFIDKLLFLKAISLIQSCLNYQNISFVT
jgi:hypothetical protein